MEQGIPFGIETVRCAAGSFTEAEATGAVAGACSHRRGLTRARLSTEPRVPRVCSERVSCPLGFMRLTAERPLRTPLRVNRRLEGGRGLGRGGSKK